MQITDDFLAVYQANYGFTENQEDKAAASSEAPGANTEEPQKPEKSDDPESNEKGEKRKKEGDPGFFCFFFCLQKAL